MNRYDSHLSFLYPRKLDPDSSPKWKPEEVKMYDEVVFQGQQHFCVKKISDNVII